VKSVANVRKRMNEIMGYGQQRLREAGLLATA